MVLEERLTDLRKKKNLTQTELAEQLSVTPQTVSSWERGTKRPSTKRLLELSRFFGVDLNVLIGGEEPNLDTPGDPAETKQKGKPNAPAPHAALRYILGTVCFLALCAVVCIIVLALCRPQKTEEKVVPISELEKVEPGILPEERAELGPW